MIVKVKEREPELLQYIHTCGFLSVDLYLKLKIIKQRLNWKVCYYWEEDTSVHT